MRSVPVVVAVALFALAVMAQPSKLNVEQAYRAWWMAHVDPSGERRCSMMTPDALPSARRHLRETDMERCLTQHQDSYSPQVAQLARTLAGLAVVDVEVDGDVAYASMRAGTCTLAALDAQFRLSATGEWRYDGGPWFGGSHRPCREQHARPPHFLR